MPFMAPHIKTARLHLQKSDPVMKRLLKQHGPFTAKAKSDRFGTLVDSIVSQQISTAAARTIKQRLRQAIMQRSGLSSQTANRNERLSPAELLQFDIEELRSLGVSKQKASYVLDLAQKVSAGHVDLDRCHQMDDEEVIQQLIQVKGIGRWTAQMFLIFSLARMDVLPTDDLGLKNAIAREYELESIPSSQQIIEIAQPWRPYATVASWYLWRSLDNEDSWN